MPSNEKEGNPPSYSESIHPTISTSSTSPGQSILDRLTVVRAQTIRTVIDTHILPLVEQQALYGIPQTIIALLPSDIPLPAPAENEFSFDAPTSTQNVEVVGFSSDEEPKVVRLEGQVNKMEFWRIQVVIEELERTLRERLNISETLRPRSPTRTVEGKGKQGKKGLFGRMVEAIGQEEIKVSDKSGIATKETVEVGQVLVKARLEEVCLRTINEFGLYDTMSKQCVVIRVDARC